MASLGTATLVTRLDLTGLRAGLNQAESTAKQSLARMGTDMTRVGRTLSLAVTAPIVGMGAAIVSTAAGFESSMNRVRALSQATGADFERLKNQAQDLGATTVYSASQAADGMSFLAMAGLEVDQIYGAMPSTLQLAAAAQLDLADAADIVTNIMTGYNISVDELENSVDVLAASFISANTDLRQLGDGMSFAGPVASGLGVAFEEATAAIGLLSNAGIQGGRAGTTLSRILAILSTEGEKLGVTIYDAAGQMLPLADILEQIEAQGMDSAEVMDFFGQRGGPGMLALLSQGSGALRDYTADLSDVGGTAERVANTQLEGLRGKWVELTSATEGLLISFGEAGLMGLVERAVVKLTDLVRWVDSWDDSTKNLVGTVAGLAAAVGPLLLGLGSLVRVLPIIATGFAVLTGPAGWITLAAVAVGGLALALSGRRDSLDSTAERAQQALADMDTQAARTESALNQLTEATDENGLRGAAEAMADTLEGEAKDSFVTLADQAIASGADITEIGDTLLEMFARLREESLNTRVAAARDLRATAQAQFQQAQAQHELARESFEFRQEQAERLASVNAQRAAQLEQREADLLSQLAEQREQLLEARGTAYESMYQGAVDATQTQLDGVRSQMDELGMAQEQLSTNLSESAENLRFAASSLGIAHENLNDALAAQYQNDLVLSGRSDTLLHPRLRGRTPTVTPSGGASGAPTAGDDVNNVVTRVNEARGAVGEVEDVTVRTAETAQDMFDAIAAGGSELDQRVAQLGGTTELTLAGLEQKAELFRAAIGRAFELEDLTAAEFEFLERRLGELTTEAENLQLMLAGHEAQLAYERSGEPVVTPRAAANQRRDEFLRGYLGRQDAQAQASGYLAHLDRYAEIDAANRSLAEANAELNTFTQSLDELSRLGRDTDVQQRQAEATKQALEAKVVLNDYTLALAESARVSREAEAAERALEEAREEARQGRLASAFDITRGAPAAGPTGSEMGVIISTLNSGLTDLDLRVSLFGETAQTARERVNLYEQAVLEAARVHGSASPQVEHFKDRLSDARDTLQFFTVSLIDARDTLAGFRALQAGDTTSIGSLASQGIIMSGPDGLTPDEAQQIGENFGGTVEDSGAELATTIIGAGQSFAQIVQSAQSGNAGGVFSGMGSLASGLMGLSKTLAPWGPVVGAGMSLLGSLFSLGGGRSQRQQAQESERNLARSTPAISITANVNQTNNLNGGIMDPGVQVELDRRTRSIVAEVLDQIGIQQYLNPGGAT